MERAGFENWITSESLIEASTEVSLDEIKTLCEGDETLEFLYEEMIRDSLRYARDVYEMELMAMSGEMDRTSAEERAIKDEARSRLHNAVIADIAALSRNLTKLEKNVSWLEKLPSPEHRSAYASVALKLAAKRYLELLETIEKEPAHE